jgi:hypothetical protein
MNNEILILLGAINVKNMLKISEYITLRKFNKVILPC